MNFEEFLKNPWVVGIVGGIVTYLITNVGASMFVGRKRKREYLAKIKLGNTEVLALMRRSLSEGIDLNKSLVTALVGAAARRHEVDVTDLLDIEAISEDLTHEVLDTSFLSASEKLNICQSIQSIVPASDAVGADSVVEELHDEIASLKRQRLRQSSIQADGVVSVTALMAGITVAAATIFSGFVDNVMFEKILDLSNDIKAIETPSLVVALTVAGIALSASGLALMRLRFAQHRDLRQSGKAYQEFMQRISEARPTNIHDETRLE